MKVSIDRDILAGLVVKAIKYDKMIEVIEENEEIDMDEVYQGIDESDIVE